MRGRRIGGALVRSNSRRGRSRTGEGKTLSAGLDSRTRGIRREGHSRNRAHCKLSGADSARRFARGTCRGRQERAARRRDRRAIRQPARAFVAYYLLCTYLLGYAYTWQEGIMKRFDARLAMAVICALAPASAAFAGYLNFSGNWTAPSTAPMSKGAATSVVGKCSTV